MANKENLPPTSSPPFVSRLSPNNKPALSRQRDHSACRKPDTPLKVRKTRENLKQFGGFVDIPPPCVHALEPDMHITGMEDSFAGSADQGSQPTMQEIRLVSDAAADGHLQVEGTRGSDATDPGPPLPESMLQRQKSVSRRMLLRVKQGLSARSKGSHSVRATESETSLARRLSGRRRHSKEIDQRSHSFEVARASVDSCVDATPDSISLVPSTVHRSFTGSTVSTADVLGESLGNNTPEGGRLVQEFDSRNLSPIPSSPMRYISPSPQPAAPPPPPNKVLPPMPTTAQLSLSVPYIDLLVTLSCDSVDLHAKHDIWVAVEATVRSMPGIIDIQTSQRTTNINITTLNAGNTTEPTSTEPVPSHRVAKQCGSISTLRLCYKPVGGCFVREVIGQKSAQSLVMGQTCSLFVKVHLPRIRIRDNSIDQDQASLFTELESIVGTLKMEILHVEARYRHRLLPSDNVVTVRHTCKVRRPKTESRWSVVGIDKAPGSPVNVHVLLAEYIAARWSTVEALELLERCIDLAADEQSAIHQIRDSLNEKRQRERHTEEFHPSVVVTDSDLELAATTTPAAPEQFATAPNTPGVDTPHKSSSKPDPPGTSNTSNITWSETLAAFAITPISSQTSTIFTSVPQQPSAVSTPPHTAHETSTATELQDSARQLWRHIRHTSLSSKQMEEITTARLGDSNTSDQAVEGLRRKAVANKRSVGAETLRGWRWENAVQQQHVKWMEAPWM